MPSDVNSGFSVSRLIDAAGEVGRGNFSFRQLDEITSGKYNVGLLKLGDGGKLVKFNNHVWKTGSNNVKVNVAENIAVRNAVFEAIKTRCRGFSDSISSEYLDLVRKELIGDTRMHLPLSRKEVRAMLNQLKVLANEDSVSRLKTDISKLDGQIATVSLKVNGMEKAVKEARELVPLAQKAMADKAEYEKLLAEMNKLHGALVKGSGNKDIWVPALNDLKAAQEQFQFAKAMGAFFEQRRTINNVVQSKDKFVRLLDVDLIDKVCRNEKTVDDVAKELAGKIKAAEDCLAEKLRKIQDLDKRDPAFAKFREVLSRIEEIQSNSPEELSATFGADRLQRGMGTAGIMSRALFDSESLRQDGLIDLKTAKQLEKELSSLKGTLKGLIKAKEKAERQLASEEVRLSCAPKPKDFLASIQKHQPETLRKEFLQDLVRRYNAHENCRPILVKIRLMLLRDDVWGDEDQNPLDTPSSSFRDDPFEQDFKDKAIALLEAAVKGVDEPQARITHLKNLDKELKDARARIDVLKKKLEGVKGVEGQDDEMGLEEKLSNAKAELSKAKETLSDAEDNDPELSKKQKAVETCQKDVIKLKKDIKYVKKLIPELTAFCKRCEAERPNKQELLDKAENDMEKGRQAAAKVEEEFVNFVRKQNPAVGWRLLFDDLAERYGSEPDFAQVFPVLKEVMRKACAENRELSPDIVEKARQICSVVVDMERQVGWYERDELYETIDSGLRELIGMCANSPKIQRETEESVVAGDKLLELRQQMIEKLRADSLKAISGYVKVAIKPLGNLDKPLTPQQVRMSAMNVNLAPLEIVGGLFAAMIGAEFDNVRDPKLHGQLQNDIKEFGKLFKELLDQAKRELDHVLDRQRKTGEDPGLRKFDYHALLKKAADIFSRPVSGISFYGGKVREQVAAALLSLNDDTDFRDALVNAQNKGFGVVQKAWGEIEEIDKNPGRVRDKPKIDQKDLDELDKGAAGNQELLDELDERHSKLLRSKVWKVKPGFDLAYGVYLNVMDDIRGKGDGSIDTTKLVERLVEVRDGLSSPVKRSGETLVAMNKLIDQGLKGESVRLFPSLFEQQFLAPLKRLFGFSDFNECRDETLKAAVAAVQKKIEEASKSPSAFSANREVLKVLCNNLHQLFAGAANAVMAHLNSDVEFILDVSWKPLLHSMAQIKEKYGHVLNLDEQLRSDAENLVRLMDQIDNGFVRIEDKRTELTKKFNNVLLGLKTVASDYGFGELDEELDILQNRFDGFKAEFSKVVQSQEKERGGDDLYMVSSVINNAFGNSRTSLPSEITAIMSAARDEIAQGLDDPVKIRIVADAMQKLDVVFEEFTKSAGESVSGGSVRDQKTIKDFNEDIVRKIKEKVDAVKGDLKKVYDPANSSLSFGLEEVDQLVSSFEKLEDVLNGVMEEARENFVVSHRLGDHAFIKP